jgi:alpha-1,6-mannosyltransferase
MIINYQTKTLKKQTNFLVISSLILSIILCTAVFWIGYTKFLAIETKTGGNYPTFPDQYTQIFIGAIYFGVNLLYILWVLQPQQNSIYKTFHFIDFLKPSLPFLLLAFICYPLGNDIYLYLHYGLMGLDGINPFIHRAGSFVSEFYDFLRWRQTSTYGPVSLLLFGISATVVPISKLLAIYLFKAFCLAAHLLNAYLVFRILQKSPYLEKVTLAYLCNPLILFEQVGSAHIDVLVCTSFLLFILCFKYKRYLLGIVAIWLGFLSKTLPILWLPLASAYLIQQKRWSSIFLAVIVSVEIVALLTFTVLPTKEAWRSLLNPGVSDTLIPIGEMIGRDTIGSLHRIVATYLNFSSSLNFEAKQVIFEKFKLFTYAVFGSYYLRTLVEIPFRRRYSEVNLALDIGWVSFILFAVATSWVMPWYASILLPAIAITYEERRFVFTSLAFCLSSTAYYVLGSTGVIQSWFVAGLPLLVLGLEMLLPRAKDTLYEPKFFSDVIPESKQD